MKLIKNLLKISLLLATVLSFAGCMKENSFEEPSGAYLQIKSNTRDANIRPDFELSDFNEFELSGRLYDYYFGEYGDSILLGTFNSFTSLQNSYIAIPETGYWEFTLVAKDDGTIFNSTETLTIVEGPNSIFFTLEPVTYSTEGKGNYTVSILLKDIPFDVTCIPGFTPEGNEYRVQAPLYSVKAKVDGVELADSVPLELLPIYDSYNEILPDYARYGTFDGTQNFIGDFKATLSATEVDAGDYMITFCVNKGTNKNLFTKTFLVTVTDGVTSTNSADFSDPSSIDYVIENTAIESAISATTFNIIYEKNGGDWANAGAIPVSFSVRDTSNSLVLPDETKISKRGYAFGGWYTTSDFQDNTDITELVFANYEADVTLYAKWNVNTYTITYCVNGGFLATDYFTIEETVIYLPSSPVPPTGKSFDGWYTTSNFQEGTQVPLIIYNIADTDYNIEDFILYAKFVDIFHNITFHTSSDTVMPADAPSRYYENTGISISSIIPTRLGYTFGGWYSTDDCQDGTGIGSIPAGTTTDIEVWPKWTKDVYDITYYPDDGEMPPEYYSGYCVDDDFDLPEPTKTGYSFAGWYTNESYSADSRVYKIEPGRTGELVLHALWTTNSYSITYYNCDDYGTNLSFDPYLTYNGYFTLPLPTGTKPDYVLLGWYTTDDFQDGTLVTEIPEGTTENIELWARWGHSITYHTADSNISNYITIFDFNEYENVTLETLSSSYSYITFEGWYTTSDFQDGTLVTEIPQGTTENVELWAKWTSSWYKTNDDTSYFFTNTSGNTWTSNNHNINYSEAISEWKINIPDGASVTVNIPWTVSSEGGWDKLTISIDNETIINAESGEQYNNTIIKTLSYGRHVLQAQYAKDSSNSYNNDEGTVTLNPVSYNW